MVYILRRTHMAVKALQVAFLEAGMPDTIWLRMPACWHLCPLPCVSRPSGTVVVNSPVFSIYVVVDGSGHEYGNHRPQRLALTVEVVCGYGVQFRLVCVSLQLLLVKRATVELGSSLDSPITLYSYKNIRNKFV